MEMERVVPVPAAVKRALAIHHSVVRYEMGILSGCKGYTYEEWDVLNTFFLDAIRTLSAEELCLFWEMA